MHTTQVLENAVSVIKTLRSAVLDRSIHANEFASLEKEAHATIQQLQTLVERGHQTCN